MKLPASNKRIAPAAAVLALAAVASAGAESRHEFLVFPSADDEPRASNLPLYVLIATVSVALGLVLYFLLMR